MCVRQHIFLLCVSVCTFRQSLASCECVNVWTEFGIVWVCVRAKKVRDLVSLCTYWQRYASWEFMYVWTEFGIVWVCVHVDRVCDRVSVLTCGQNAKKRSSWKASRSFACLSQELYWFPWSWTKLFLTSQELDLLRFLVAAFRTVFVCKQKKRFHRLDNYIHILNDTTLRCGQEKRIFFSIPLKSRYW